MTVPLPQGLILTTPSFTPSLHPFSQLSIPWNGPSSSVAGQAHIVGGMGQQPAVWRRRQSGEEERTTSSALGGVVLGQCKHTHRTHTQHLLPIPPPDRKARASHRSDAVGAPGGGGSSSCVRPRGELAGGKAGWQLTS